MTTALTTLYRVDHAEQVFVMEGADGVLFRCTFQEAVLDTADLATLLGEDVKAFGPGDPAVLHEHSRLVQIIVDENLKPGTWYGAAASPELRKALEKVRREETLVRLWFGDTQTPPYSVWLVDDSTIVIGNVTRTEGPLKQPVLKDKVLNARYILAVSTWEPEHDAPVFLWQHEHFRLPDLRMLDTPEGCSIQAVTSTGELITLLRDFHDRDLASKWIRLHTGMKPTNIT